MNPISTTSPVGASPGQPSSSNRSPATATTPLALADSSSGSASAKMEVTSVGRSTTVGPLLTYVKYYVAKSTNMEALVQHVLLAALLLCSLFVGTLPERAAGLASAAASRRVSSAAFNAISNASGWSSWFSSVLMTHYDLATLDSGGGLATSSPRIASVEALLYGFHIEYYRIKEVDCADQTDDGALTYLRAIDPRRYGGSKKVKCYPNPYSARDALRDRPTPLPPQLMTNVSVNNTVMLVSYPLWTGTASGVTVLANGTTFHPGMQTKYCADTATQGLFASYNCGDSSRTVFIDATGLNTSTGLAEALYGVQEMTIGNLVTNVDSRAISVTALYFHRSSALLIRVVALLEIGDAGAVQTTIELSTNHVMSIGRGVTTINVVIFTLDLLVGISAAIALWTLLYRVGLLIQLNSRISNALDTHILLDTAILTLLGVYVGYRYALWVEVSDGRKYPPPASMSRADALGLIISICGRDRLAREIGAWLMLAVVFRIMYCLRYVSRVSLVFETIAASASQFLSMTIPFMTILLAYGCAGTCLWYNVTPSFANIGRAILTLFNFAVALDTSAYYSALVAEHKTVTLIYFVTYFLISWGVLMNVLIGVLANAFATAKNTQVVVRRPEWSVAAVWRDARSLWSRRTETRAGAPHPYLSDDMTEVPEHLTGFNVSTCAGEGHFAVLRDPKWHPLLRITLVGTVPRANTARAVLLLERLRAIKKAYGNDHFMTVEDVCRLSLFDPAVTQRMVTKAEMHVGVSDAGHRRWLIMQKLLRMERDVSAQLSVQFRQLQELTETLCGAELGAEIGSSSDSDDDEAHNALEGSQNAVRPSESPSTDAAEDDDTDTTAPEDAAVSDEGGNGSNAAFPSAPLVQASSAPPTNPDDELLKQQREEQRAAAQSTLREVQSLVMAVDSAVTAAQQRHLAFQAVADVAQLTELCAEVERLAQSIGVVVM